MSSNIEAAALPNNNEAEAERSSIINSSLSLSPTKRSPVPARESSEAQTPQRMPLVTDENFQSGGQPKSELQGGTGFAPEEASAQDQLLQPSKRSTAGLGLEPAVRVKKNPPLVRQSSIHQVTITYSRGAPSRSVSEEDVSLSGDDKDAMIRFNATTSLGQQHKEGALLSRNSRIGSGGNSQQEAVQTVTQNTGAPESAIENLFEQPAPPVPHVSDQATEKERMPNDTPLERRSVKFGLAGEPEGVLQLKKKKVVQVAIGGAEAILPGTTSTGTVGTGSVGSVEPGSEKGVVGATFAAGGKKAPESRPSQIGGILKKFASISALKKKSTVTPDIVEEPAAPVLMKPRRSSFITQEIDDYKLQKTQEHNIKLLQATIDPHWGSEITQMINTRQKKNESNFAIAWSKIILVVNTYNFFTCFFFMGIVGYPFGLWYMMEIMAEILLVFNFFAKYVFRSKFRFVWMDMYLLHDRKPPTRLEVSMRLIAAFPSSILLSSIFINDRVILDSFGVASLRLLKLLNFSQVSNYFRIIDFRQRSSSEFSLNGALFVFYYMLLFAHFMAQLWFITARLDSQAPNKIGWLTLQAKFQELNASLFEQWLEGMYFSVSTLTGGAMGNIIPLTNTEFGSATFINLMGRCAFVGMWQKIAIEYLMRNTTAFENKDRLERCKQFAQDRALPEQIKKKIRYYYNNLSFDFEQYNKQANIIEELPDSIRSQVSLMFNKRIIERVKFIQSAKPAFILQIVKSFKPQISMSDDFIVRVHEIADKMYFIQEGFVEIICSDNVTPIAYFSTGSYFGEIGVLITGVRTVSVKTKTNSVLYFIESEALLEAFKQDPEQLNFLRAIGYQRLETTDYEQLIEKQDGPRDECDDEANTPFAGKTGFSQIDSQRSQLTECFETETQELFNRAQSSVKPKIITNHRVKTKLWLTSQYNMLEPKIIIPMSPIFIIWTIILSTAFLSQMILITYGVGFEQNILFNWVYITCTVIYFIDIPIRAKTGATEPQNICLVPEQIITYYINKWLIWDVLSTLPFEYLTFFYSEELTRYLLLMKLVKFGRVMENFLMIKSNTNQSVFWYFFLFLFVVFGVASHVLGCIIGWVARREAKWLTRYDQKTFAWSFEQKPWVQLGPLFDLPPIDQYAVILHYGFQIISQVTYGEVVPWAASEAILTILGFFVGRIIIAMLFFETSQQLGNSQKHFTAYTQSSNMINKWANQNKLPESLRQRIIEFNLIRWRNNFNIDDNQILANLPPQLSQDIKIYLLSNLIKAWEVAPREKFGQVISLLSELTLVQYPESEFIVKTHEIGKEMFFIVEGLCQVFDSNGEKLDILKSGQNFGEMALIDTSQPFRLASVYTLTNVTCAVLTKERFDRVCKIYPQFKENIIQRTKQRKREMELDLNKQPVKKKKTKTATKKEFKKQQTTLKQLDSIDEQVKEESEFSENSSLSESEQKQSAPGSVSSRSRKSSRSNSQRGSRHSSKPSRRNSTRKVAGRRNSTMRQSNKFMRQRTKRRISIIPGAQMKGSTPEIDYRSMASSDKFNNMMKRQSQIGFKAFSDAYGVDYEEQKLMQKLRSQIVIQTSSLTDYLENSKKKVSRKKKLKKLVKQLRIKQNILLLFSVYNVFFIPIQFAFKIPFEGHIFYLEVATIVLYAFDITYRLIKIRRLFNLHKIPDHKLRLKDKRLKRDSELKSQAIRNLKLEIVLLAIAIFPFSLLFQMTVWIKPRWVTAALCSLRIVNYVPIRKMFLKLSTYSLNSVRIIEVIFYYYILSNWYACLSLQMTLYEDWTQNALRRVPVPQPDLFRRDPNVKDDITKPQLYLHALYFVVSTFSEVAVADITCTNIQEFWVGSLFLWTTTFLYILLFANVASLIQNLQSEQMQKFVANRNYILRKIQDRKVPDKILTDVNYVFDLKFSRGDICSQDEITGVLPDRLKQDIMMSQYVQFIENCVLFRTKEGNIDITLTQVLLREVRIQTFLADQYVVKVGQSLDKTILVFDGFIRVICINDYEIEGYLEPGDFYSTTLNEEVDEEYNTQYFKETIRQEPPKLKIHPLENFQSRSVLNLVADTYLTVGMLDEASMKMIYSGFPQLEHTLTTTNRYLFDIGRKAIESTLTAKNKEHTIKQFDCLLSDTFQKTTRKQYNSIVYKCVYRKYGKKVKSLSTRIKNYYIGQQEAEVQQAINQVLIKTQEGRMLRGQKKKSMKNRGLYDMQFVIEEHSIEKELLQYLQFLNIVYIAIACPFYTGFDIQAKGFVLLLEVLSHLISFLIFITYFMTPIVNEQGEKSLEFFEVAKKYWKNGMILDFVGVIPLTIVFSRLYVLKQSSVTYQTMLMIGLIKSIRLFSIIPGLKIFQLIKLRFKKREFFIRLGGNIFFLILVTHWLICAWVFLILLVEQNDQLNWMTEFVPPRTPMPDLYLRCLYCVINITTSVGSGDNIAVTDKERIFFICMMTTGDIVFGLAFGLISDVVLDSKKNNPVYNFIDNMIQIERIMEKNKLNSSWKDRVDQYYTYQFKIQQESMDIEAEELLKHFPRELVKEIMYFSYSKFITPLFKVCQSDNMLMDVCFCLKNKIYMPDDVIFERKQKSQLCYFIIEGTVIIINGKGEKIGKKRANEYFGHFCLAGQKIRLYTAVSSTFVLTKTLSTEDFEKILQSYPIVQMDFAKMLEDLSNQTYQNDISKTSPLQNKSRKQSVFFNENELEVNLSANQLPSVTESSQKSNSVSSSRLVTEEDSLDDDVQSLKKQQEIEDPYMRKLRMMGSKGNSESNLFLPGNNIPKKPFAPQVNLQQIEESKDTLLSGLDFSHRPGDDSGPTLQKRNNSQKEILYSARSKAKKRSSTDNQTTEVEPAQNLFEKKKTRRFTCEDNANLKKIKTQKQLQKIRENSQSFSSSSSQDDRSLVGQQVNQMTALMKQKTMMSNMSRLTKKSMKSNNNESKSPIKSRRLSQTSRGSQLIVTDFGGLGMLAQQKSTFKLN